MKICLICGVESEFPVCEKCAKTKVGQDTLMRLKAKTIIRNEKITFKRAFFILFLLVLEIMVIVWMASK